MAALAVVALLSASVAVALGLRGPTGRGTATGYASEPTQRPLYEAIDDFAQPADLPPETPEAGAPSVDVPILMYHYIRINPNSRDRVGFELSVTPENFAAQMRLLADAGAHTGTMGEVMGALEAGRQLPPRTVVLTFDDGYDDFATAAAPILAEHHFVGLDYVVSGFVGRPGYMDEAALHRVLGMGMVLGAHTVHHVDLGRVPQSVARVEIDDSRTALEAMTGQPIEDFAYPYGGYDAGVVTLVQQAGFREAVTTRPGSVHTWHGRFTLSRERIGGHDTLASFAAKVHLTRGSAPAGPPAGAAPFTPEVTPAAQGGSAPTPTPDRRQP